MRYFGIKMKVIILLCALVPVIAIGQIPRNAKTIVVKNVSFADVCGQLLDKGYSIEKKDDQLQTLRTENRKYPKLWNAAYKIDIRVKDSTAYISGTYTAPYEDPLTIAAAKREPLWNNEPIYHRTSSKGKPQSKSLQGYAFGLLNEFALSFNKPVEYSL